ncbi:OsmC family protein [Streptomyces sp. JHA26]|uniref:OsmC family protein n=1 Tax=Streptomyces sp. JHA26 TaxID=1917143 RepID=UPI000989E8E0|nr:OsmC family protein [Streptomyces sp. JHA26]
MKLQTRCGRTINVTRFAPQELPARMGRVVLDTSFTSHDEGELWASLTVEEARRLAGLLLFQAAAVEPQPRGVPGVVEVVPVVGDAYEIRVRGHVLTVDQPLADGGKDTAPTPVELFVAAVASCAAHDAGRFLDRHGAVRDGLSVRAEHRMAEDQMAEDRPARVASLSLTVVAPALSPERLAALRSVVSPCTVTNTLRRAPDVELDVRWTVDEEAASRRTQG